MTDNINFKRIENDIATHEVVLYMNGTPMFPRCCSSAMAAQFLDFHKVSYQFFNLMEEISLMDTLKAYTGSSAVPQLFIRGELVGTGEEIRESVVKGKLSKILKEYNLTKV